MEGLIKLTGEIDSFYDSVTKQYRYRMHCPECGKASGCRCFNSLEKMDYALSEENSLDLCCSSKCCLIYNVREIEVDDFINILIEKKYISWWDRIKAFIFSKIEKEGFLSYICFYIIETFKIKLNYSDLAQKLTEEQAREVIDEINFDFDEPEGESCGN